MSSVTIDLSSALQQLAQVLAQRAQQQPSQSPQPTQTATTEQTSYNCCCYVPAINTSYITDADSCANAGGTCCSTTCPCPQQQTQYQQTYQTQPQYPQTTYQQPQTYQPYTQYTPPQTYQQPPQYQLVQPQITVQPSPSGMSLEQMFPMMMMFMMMAVAISAIK